MTNEEIDQLIEQIRMSWRLSREERGFIEDMYKSEEPHPIWDQSELLTIKKRIESYGKT